MARNRHPKQIVIENEPGISASYNQPPKTKGAKNLLEAFGCVAALERALIELPKGQGFAIIDGQLAKIKAPTRK